MSYSQHDIEGFALDKLTAICTKCQVALEVDDIKDDESVVRCPICKTEFGKWGDVQVTIAKMAGDELKETAKQVFKDIPWIKVT